MSPDDSFEDGTPLLEPPSVPPIPIEQLRPPNTREADTIPVPDVAQQVIEALAPKLDDILTAIGELKVTVGHLSNEVVDLRANKIITDATIGAIDRGVRGLMNATNTLDATMAHLRAAQQDTTNRVLELNQTVANLDRTLTTRIEERHDRAIARIVSLEDVREEQRAQEEAIAK